MITYKNTVKIIKSITMVDEWDVVEAEGANGIA